MVRCLQERCDAFMTDPVFIEATCCTVAVSVRPAVGAQPVRLRCRPAHRSAVGAYGTVEPDQLLKPEAGGPLGWKHLGVFDQADALALEPLRSLAPVRRSIWDASVSFTDVHELGAFSARSVQICQQALKMPEAPVGVGVQRSVCSQRICPQY